MVTQAEVFGWNNNNIQALKVGVKKTKLVEKKLALLSSNSREKASTAQI